MDNDIPSPFSFSDRNAETQRIASFMEELGNSSFFLITRKGEEEYVHWQTHCMEPEEVLQCASRMIVDALKEMRRRERYDGETSTD